MFVKLQTTTNTGLQPNNSCLQPTFPSIEFSSGLPAYSSTRTHRRRANDSQKHFLRGEPTPADLVWTGGRWRIACRSWCKEFALNCQLSCECSRFGGRKDAFLRANRIFCLPLLHFVAKKEDFRSSLLFSLQSPQLIYRLRARDSIS